MSLILACLLVATPAHADFQSGAEAYARGDYQAAINEWLPYAADGDPRALFNLAQMNRLGVGTPKDLVKAEQYYRRAAEFGHVGAQANLGAMLFERKPPQGEEAVRFWRQAARGGDVKSQYWVGTQYFNGDYVTRDYVQAYAWLSLAAKAGLREAAEALATTRSYMDAAAIQQASALAGTLVVPLPAQATVAPTMPALVPEDMPAQLEGAVLRHPVDDFNAADLEPISPDSFSGAIPIPAPDMARALLAPVTPPPVPVQAAAAPEPVKPVPVLAADDRNVEYRVQFATLKSGAEAAALKDALLAQHAKLLGEAGVQIDEFLSGTPQALTYRVRSGALKGEKAARKVCAAVDKALTVCQPAKHLKIPISVKSEARQPAPVPPVLSTPAQAPTVQPKAEPEPILVRDTQPPAPAEPEPTPAAEHAGDNWRVQVGAGRSEEEARFRWARLMGTHPDLLDAAELYIYKADLGSKGVFYRVQIGGFTARPAAIGLCERLKARKVDCFVTATHQ